MDSFCGGGTTLLACKEAGINSMGFDILPFSVFLTNVKTRSYNEAQLESAKKKLTYKKSVSLNIPSLTNIPIAKKAFTPSVRNELLRIKESIINLKDNHIRDFFNLGLLSILETVSKTSKSGGFLRLVDKRVLPETIQPIFASKIDSMIADVKEFNGTFSQKKVSASAKHSDARSLSTTRKFDAIITSPPYPNRHDYSRIYSLEMLFDFVSDNDDLKQIRYETLRSHVEARKKFDTNDYIKPKSLVRLINRVKSNGVNNPQIINMLEGYFEDMFLSLREMKNKLENKGKIALVVSNVRFSGINIPVDELLSDVGEQAGLSPKNIFLARYRGNSSQQMGQYNRNPSRESIVIWEK